MDFKVLILDDEQRIILELSEFLVRKGFMVKSAQKPSQALDLLGREDFDIFILDIRLPEMDGIQALKKIKEADAKATVIMCSAMGQQAMVIESIQAGARDFIVKPFQADRVLEAVKKVIG